MELSTKIRKIRELKGISQENMATRLGMSQAGYSRLEKDDKLLTFDKLESIAEVLEMDPMKILQFDEQMIFINNSNQAGGNAANIVVQSYSEKELYETQIETLKKEIDFLRELIKKEDKI